MRIGRRVTGLLAAHPLEVRGRDDAGEVVQLGPSAPGDRERGDVLLASVVAPLGLEVPVTGLLVDQAGADLAVPRAGVDKRRRDVDDDVGPVVAVVDVGPW